MLHTNSREYFDPPLNVKFETFPRNEHGIMRVYGTIGMDRDIYHNLVETPTTPHNIRDAK